MASNGGSPPASGRKTRKKSKAATKPPPNKERFEILEQRMDTVTTAIDRLTDALAGLNPADPPADFSQARDNSSAPQHSIHTSTPKRQPAKRPSISSQNSVCDISALDALPHTNVDLLGARRTQRHADQVFRATSERFPRADGKTIFDQYLNRPVQYCMPRHFLAPHSQRRIKMLESYDDLNVAEFLQGYTAMILKNDIKNPVVLAMITQLHKLGEALVDYEWSDMRDWVNATLHDIGQQRYRWVDSEIIHENYNATKMRASRNKDSESVIPVCGPYNQGKCERQASHGPYQHICVACWLNNGASYPHPYTACRRKNSQGGTQGRGYNRDQQPAAQQGNGPYRQQHSAHFQSRNQRQNDTNRHYASDPQQQGYQNYQNVPQNQNSKN